MQSLGELVTLALEAGWVSAPGEIARLAEDARELGWQSLGQRAGHSAIVELKPTDPIDAPPRSLSALVGRGLQPLHTDGAYLPFCPDVLVLACPGGSATPTRLWKATDVAAGRTRIPEALGAGLFLVEAGSSPFFAAAYENGRFRYDPGCMSPCDARAREAAALLTPKEDDVIEHRWEPPGQVLVIDNRRVLHARGDASREPGRMMLRAGFAIGALR